MGGGISTAPKERGVNMMKEYQVTLFDPSNTYKPVSCIISKNTNLIEAIGKEAYIKRIKEDGIKKICAKRYWRTTDLVKYGYTKMKIREYDKEKIAKENAERYEQIKKERGWD
jgi:hypothetical protein